MLAEVKFSYGDLRVDNLVKKFYQSILEKCSICIRAIAGSRKNEVAFHRLIKNSKFNKDKILEEAVCHSQGIAKNIDHILCIQDTTELMFDTENTRVREGLGPLTVSYCKGFFLHPGLLVDASNYAILGVSDIIHWVRKEKTKRVPEDKKRDMSYKKLPIEKKESYRWLKLAENTKLRFSHVKRITIIADRESDIYEEWDRIPNKQVQLITRASRDRNLSDGTSLYAKLDERQPSFNYSINLSEITGKREKRNANISVSYTSVKILRPQNYKNRSPNESILLNAILVKETTETVLEKDRIVWRLLTTHTLNEVNEVRQIITWYTKRWLIEQLFRTLKTQGINIESSQLEKAESLLKLSIAALITAVKTMQLVQARNGLNNRELDDVFTKEDEKILEKLNVKLEGKTEKQKNPHKKSSLAWGGWIIARLGGWMGYRCERPPGPITMKRGLDFFQKIKFGWMLEEDVCIP